MQFGQDREWPVRATVAQMRVTFPAFSIVLSHALALDHSHLQCQSSARRTRTPNRQSKANGSARDLLVCPRETGTCDSGCSSAGGRGRADHVERCFFASQEKRAMKLTLVFGK